MELFTTNIIPERTLGEFFQTAGESFGVAPTVPTVIVGGTIQGAAYKSNDSGARVEIRPEWDPTIGIVAYNASESQIFKIEIDGTNTGDITIGNYAGDQGVLWDQSGGTFNIKGTFTATAGTIGGWTLASGYIYSLASGTPTSSPSDGVVMASTNQGFIVYENTEKRVEVGYLASGVYGIKVYDDDGTTVIFEASDTQKIITSGVIGTGSEISIQGWTHDLVFSVSDANTVAWASGTITLMNGDTFSIEAGNTGDMSAETFVYLDIGTSETVLQTSTTKTDAVGTGKILVAIAENATDEAEFIVFGSADANYDGGKIRTNSITANEIAANTITAAEIYAGTITTSELNFTPYVVGTNTLDDIDDGSTYGKVLNTQISAGEILLSAVSGDLDDIADGSSYGKVALTSISAGKIILTSGTGVDGSLPVANTDAKCTDANADQTSVNTSADTTAVGGLASSTVAGWQYGATTYIDGGDIQTGTIVALGTVTAGAFVCSTSGYLRGGQTAYNTGTGFFLGYDTDAYKFSIGDASSNYVTWDGSTLEISGNFIRTSSIFGDGSDEAGTISSNTNLTEDKYYTDCTISNNAVLSTKGYRLFVSGTLTIGSGCKIENNGSDATSGTTHNGAGESGGAGGAGGFFPAGIAGGTGGASSGTPTPGDGQATDKSNVVGSNGAAGGNGGDGTHVNGPGDGGQGTATITTNPPVTSTELKNGYDVVNSAQYEACAGSGGGGSGGAAAGGDMVSGQGAGGSGGWIGIYAKEIVNNGTIEANGGDGGTQTSQANAGCGGGGGGAGGNGGVIILMYQKKTGAGTVTVTGGTKGTGGQAGAGGSNGSDGNDGATGVTYEIQI